VRTLYWLWSMLMFVAIVVQIGFAGYGAFNAAGKLEDEGAVVSEETFGHGFDAHIVLGYSLLLLGLIFLLIGIAAGVGKWRLGRHGVLFLLLVLQLFLAWFGFESPFIGFFHPVNALVLFSLSGWIAWDEWQRRKAAPSPAAAT
jgi:hypothetical protein